MGEKTTIEWTDHTVNFWWGCMKVSPGCQHCYAETFSRRVGRRIWGPPLTTERWRTSGPWRDILKWDARAGAEGVRRKVFAQSMSDFFEDHPQLGPWRVEACGILESLKNLDVQLLTKRTENILSMVPAHWLDNWPAHIWIGASVEDQANADKRIPELLKIPARIRFLSMEPLLGAVDLRPWLYHWSGVHEMWMPLVSELQDINWVIVGGESGHNARHMHPHWARLLLQQCQAAGVPFLFKQWGEWLPTCPDPDMERFDLDTTYIFEKVGKHAAGRLLDGVEWSQFPQ